VTSTMQLVKKQKTWFKRDQSILWSDMFADNHTELNLKIQDFLNSPI